MAQSSSSYEPSFPQPSFAEMDPGVFWDAVCACCRATANNVAEPVTALCLSSHGETFVATDLHGRPLAPAIFNQDSRATSESQWLEQAVGGPRLFQITGLLAHPMYPLPKILWLRKHEPQIYASARCFVTVVGYVLQKMGFAPHIDYSLASRFLAFDVRRQCWSDELLDATKIERDRLPDPVPAATIVGRLNSEAAGQLGIPVGAAVVLGGHDQPCAALGAGNIVAGRVSDSIGTYECLLAVSESPILNDDALSASLNSYCHVVPGRYVTVAYFPSGIMVKWLQDLLYPGGARDSASETPPRELGARPFESLEAEAPAGPTGLCVTPHLIGTCNPEFNPRARGLIAGLRPETRRAHLYKGILEGLAFELSLVAGALAKAVGRFDDIYVTGGGVRSALGLQLRAALTGRRLHVMCEPEAACLGSAILAGVAIGEYKNLQQAVDALVRPGKVLAPDETLAAAYQDQLKQYCHLRSVAIQLAEIRATAR